MSVTHRAAGLPARPTLDDLAERVGNEEWLAALALLRVAPPVAADAAQWTRWDEQSGRYTADDPGESDLPADVQVRTFHPAALMDRDGWVADVDTIGRGWSSTERRVFALVAALVVDGRTVALQGVLDQLSWWEPDVLDVLVQWASGGNNREHPGRLRITPTGASGELAESGQRPGHGAGRG